MAAHGSAGLEVNLETHFYYPPEADDEQGDDV